MLLLEFVELSLESIEIWKVVCLWSWQEMLHLGGLYICVVVNRKGCEILLRGKCVVFR